MRLSEGVGAFSAILIALVPINTKSEARTMIPCTPSIEPAITVTVADAQTDTPLRATIVVTDGNFIEELNLRGVTAAGQVIYGGAFERPGVYTVRVSREGYETSTLKDIKVTKDRCHVETRNIKVTLKKSVNRR
ncbi:MAG: hypothetical protein Fur006_24630 [Coleofasciculaceae cyanobacterium]